MEQLTNEKDRELWRIAKKRVKFKRHLVAYVIVNGFLWLLWLISSKDLIEERWPWPVWSTLGWGFGLAWAYADAYILTRTSPIEQEYERLKNKQPNNS